MKILLSSVSFMPAFAFGGPPKVAYDIAKELTKRKHEVVVYTTDAKDVFSRLNVKPCDLLDGIEVHYFRNTSLAPVRASKLFITPSLIPAVKNNLKRFDLVHLHEYRSFQNIVIHHYASRYHSPYVLQAHGSLLPSGAKPRFKKLFDSVFGYNLLNDTSKLIALNQEESKQYQQMGLLKEKISIIPNGLDFSAYRQLPRQESFKKKFGIAKDKKIILFMGRINWTKGVLVLVKAQAYLMRNLKFHDSILAIVGPDNGCLNETQTLANSLGIKDSVIFTGPLYGQDKLAAYVDADVCVLPSTYEAFPMTLLEACACGKPIIASKISTLQDFVNQAGGFFFELQNSQQLAMRLLEILSDSKGAARMGIKGKAFVEANFSIEKVVDQLEDLYEHVIET